MSSTNIVRNIEVSHTECFRIVTVATSATIAKYTKVKTLDNKILWFNDTTDASPSATAPIPGAGEALVGCGGESDPITLCDFDVTTGERLATFIRVYSYDSEFNAITKDYELDGTTPYTVVGNEGSCANEEAIVLNSPSGIATNGSPITIPANVQSYSIVNLGENAEGTVYDDIVLSGGVNTTLLGSAPNDTGISVSVEEDQNRLAGNITVTPAGTGQARVTYVI